MVFGLALVQLSEFMHFLDALTSFELSNLLAFADIATEIAISQSLRLSDTLCEPPKHTFAFCPIPRDAMFGANTGFVCDLCEWQEVVNPDVGVAAR